MGYDNYSLSELIEATHSDRRLTQFWVEFGALKATDTTAHQGRGKRRRFCRDEAIIACLLTALSFSKTTIGQLIRFSEVMRSKMLNHGPERELIEAAIIGNKKVFVYILDDIFMQIGIIADPNADWAFKFFQSMTKVNRRGTGNRHIIFINPWLEALQQ